MKTSTLPTHMALNRLGFLRFFLRYSLFTCFQPHLARPTHRGRCAGIPGCEAAPALLGTVPMR